MTTERLGQQVLINGASGGVGSFAVQMAKAFDTEVTAVCNTSKVEMVRALGADHIIDYAQENFTQSAQQYDLILGVGGYYPLTAYKRALKPNGIYAMTGGETKQMFETMFLGSFMSMTGSKKLTNFIVKPNQKDLTLIKGWLEADKLTPALDRCYPLRQVPEAIEYLEAGRVRGKVVISARAPRSPALA